MKTLPHGLPPGTRIDAYEIRTILGGGGFSIVYLACHCADAQTVVIKEYMPGKLARRTASGTVLPVDPGRADLFNRGLKLFIQEAGILASLKHPNIVNVLSFFRAHGTVYLVMEYEAGKNLQDYIRTRGGHLSERFLRTVFPPLLEGLRLIHARGLLHLDIKPDNIHLRPGGRPLLLDFGAVHRYHQSRQHQLGRVTTAGYSPIEQYAPGGYVGPWTDIYAIGATLRTCLDGQPPPPAPKRREHDTLRPAALRFRKKYSPELLQAIDWALEVDPLLRPQRVDELLAALHPPAADMAPPAARPCTKG